MKNLFLCLSMLFLMACEPKVVNKNDLSIVIESIQSNLPIKCSLGYWSNCWSQYSVDKKEFFVSSDKIIDTLNYFRNLGYSVSNSDGKLSFDFSKEYRIYKKHKNVFISFEISMVLSVLFMFFLYMANFMFKRKKHIKKIKEVYNNSKDIGFWKESDKVLLESCLAKNQLPVHWIFKFDDESKTFSCTYYNGYTFGAITYSKKSIKSSIGNLFVK